ncbi:MAG: methyltransferase domain-containing protein [Planctomycetota bacterium]|jgi:SAM-dependent methyltransferase
MPPDSPGERFLTPYREAVERHGPSFEATLWGSRAAQQLRFDVMIDQIEPRGCTLLDAGCGQGDFAQRLLDRDIDFAHYVGIDALEPMIESARERRLDDGRGRVRFEVMDLLAGAQTLGRFEADYVCISGTLNTMDEATARSLVKAAYEQAAQGVVFNFLSDRCHQDWAERDLRPARRFDTVGWLDWSMRLSSRVSFTQAYLDGHDATIAIHHEGR